MLKTVLGRFMCVLIAIMLATGACLAEYEGGAPISPEPVEISVLSCNSGSKTTAFADMTWWHMALEKANVKLDMEIIDDSSYNDVAQPRLVAAQDLPDIVRVSGNATTLAQSGVFIPLNDLIDKYGYNIKKQFEKNPTLKSAITMTDGSIYYIPYLYTTESNSRTMILNVPFLEALGLTLDDIKTLDDLYDYLVLVRDNDLNNNGDPSDEIPLFVRSGMINLLGLYFEENIINTNGYNIDENGQVYCSYIQDNYLEYLTFINKLYTEGLLFNEFLSANYDMQTAMFAENRIGAIPHFVSNATSYSTAINPDWNFFTDEPIMQIVALEDTSGQPVVIGRGILGSNYGITSNCKDPETVMKFIDYMYSEEVGVLTWYGVEGEDYNIVDGEYVFTEKYYRNPENYRGTFGYNCDALPGYQYDYSSVQCPTIAEQIREAAQYVVNPSRVQVYFTDEQNEVINTYLSDLSTYFAENMTAFIIGTRSLDEWQDYVDGAIDMGVMNLIEVYQEVADSN